MTEPTPDEVPVQTDLTSQVKRKRTVRTKGQLPSRASERLKEKATQKPKALFSISAGIPSQATKTHGEGSQSHLDADTGEGNTNIKDRVENDLKGKQEVKPTGTNQPSASSTSLSRNKNVNTES